MKVKIDSIDSSADDAAHYASVAVDQALDTELTYRIPADYLPVVKIGSRVRVPLGRGNRPVDGTVLAVTDLEPLFQTSLEQKRPLETGGVADASVLASNGQQDSLWHIEPVKSKPVSRIKNILGVFPEIDPVPTDLLEMARWISRYYCCPLGLVLSTIVPAAVKKNVRLPQQRYIHCAEDGPVVAATLAGFVLRTQNIFHKTRESLVNGPLAQDELLKQTALSKPMLKRFISAGLLRVEKRMIWPDSARLGLPQSTKSLGNTDAGFELTSEQSMAMAALEPLLDPPIFTVRMIFGVTGSGKTELYIRCIDKVVASGRQAIVLVPEISLTAQLINRFTARFERVAVLHSGMADAQRHQNWHSIAAGWAQVIIGARSAIFAPVPKLGLIIVDEEHESSYKQDNAPRYHGRDVAIRRGQMSGVPVLLGSATPSLESWRNAEHNAHYGLIKLTTRPRGLLMPRVLTVDMREERHRRRGLHAMSMVLEQRLKEMVAEKGQAIFLLNRRGYAHYVACPRCDFVLMCDRCDATMVVHRHTDDSRAGAAPGEFIQCHYCLTNQRMPMRCPDCQSRLVQLGQGTQRVEEELLKKFPDIRMARMDSDSMRHARDYQETLQQFADGKLDMLLGTQMIAKGLDFPNVTLVGVLNADLAMSSPDFRASERTFQLICQVAGRCGRTEKPGLVIVQTMQPQEPAVMYAARHDYVSFVKLELENRQTFNYPPFGRMVRLILSDTDYIRLQTEADTIMAMIRESTAYKSGDLRHLGPQNAPMQRIDEKYRMEIMIFAAIANPLQKMLAQLRQHGLFHRFKANVAVDVDPMSMQ